MRVACVFFDQPAPTSQVAELFLRLSPQICLRKDRAVFIEIGKCRSLYSEEGFLRRAAVILRRSSLRARIRVAPDLPEALALAMFQKPILEDLPLSALLELADPFDRDPLLRKSVGLLVASFSDLGVKTIGQFRRIPVGDLISRFGVVGRHCHARANREGGVLWPSWSPPEVVRERQELPCFEFYGELEPLLFVLKSQLDRIFARLFARKKRLVQLRVDVACERTSVHRHHLRRLTFDFFVPQTGTKGTLRIIKERLLREFEARPVLSPIEALETRVLRTAEAGSRQKNLFHSREEKEESLANLHNQLIELLGTESVYQAVLTEDRRPEKSWRKDPSLCHREQESRDELLAFVPERPTYLCATPLPLRMRAGVIEIQRRPYRILHWSPAREKISGGWFEEPRASLGLAFERTYFHVLLEGPQRIWVFQDADGRFFLHGYDG